MTETYKKLNQLEAYSTAYHSIEDTYKTDAGKKFIHHLIDSFVERDVAFILFSKKKLFDCITKSQLKTLFDRDNPCKDQDILDIMNQVKTAENPDDKFNILKKASDLVRDRYPKRNTNRTAMRSKSTNKILGLEEFQALVDFTQDQVNKGDKTIIRMVKYSKFRNSPNFKVNIPSNKNSKSKAREERDGDIQDKLQQLVNKYKH